MSKFHLPGKRIIPFVSLGLGISFQNYKFTKESISSRQSESVGLNGQINCPDGYELNGSICSKISEKEYILQTGEAPVSNTISFKNGSKDFINIHFPLSLGIEYLITNNFGMFIEGNYQLYYSFGEKEDFYVGFVSDYNDDKESHYDVIPIRQLNHSISATGGLFIYF